MTGVRLWPSTDGSGGAVTSGNLTLGTEFEVSTGQGIYAVWFYSAPGALLLPSACAVWDLGTQAALVQSLSPTWSGTAGSGWVSCPFDGTVTVSPGGHYATSAYSAGASAWRYHTPSYWTTGAGSAGISNGVLSAPPSAAAVNGQGCAATGLFACPTASGAGQNFWVDVEVGDPLVIAPGTVTPSRVLAAAVTPAQAAAATALAASLAERVSPGQAPASTVAITKSTAASVTTGRTP